MSECEMKCDIEDIKSARKVSIILLHIYHFKNLYRKSFATTRIFLSVLIPNFDCNFEVVFSRICTFKVLPSIFKNLKC